MFRTRRKSGRKPFLFHGVRVIFCFSDYVLFLFQLHLKFKSHFQELLPYLRTRKERFVGDFASTNGKSFYHPKETASKWFRRLRTLLTKDHTAQLRFPASPRRSQSHFTPIQHPPNSIVGMPIETSIPHTYVPDTLNYFRVIHTYTVEEEPTVDLTPLIAIPYRTVTAPVQIKIGNRWKDLTLSGTIRIPNTRKRDITVSKAKDLYQIKTYTAFPIRHRNRKHMAYLILTTDSANRAGTDHNYRGRTALTHISDIINKKRYQCTGPHSRH